MTKLKFHGAFLLTLFFCTLTLFDVALGDKGVVASSKMGKSNGKDLLPLRFKFKQVDPSSGEEEEDDDCEDKTCQTGEADDCHLKKCGKCKEGYDICSEPVDCADIDCTPPTTPEEEDECFNHQGCGRCHEVYTVCTFLSN